MVGLGGLMELDSDREVGVLGAVSPSDSEARASLVRELQADSVDLESATDEPDTEDPDMTALLAGFLTD
jgi:hypothetical protein